jgi:membrane protein implicated in regulation of membrane protease activity
MDGAGRFLIVAGLILVVLGALFSVGALHWLGRLPGDIRVERPGMKLFIPITTSILLSVLISLALYLVSKFRH